MSAFVLLALYSLDYWKTTILLEPELKGLSTKPTPPPPPLRLNLLESLPLPPGAQAGVMVILQTPNWRGVFGRHLTHFHREQKRRLSPIFFPPSFSRVSHWPFSVRLSLSSFSFPFPLTSTFLFIEFLVSHASEHTCVRTRTSASWNSSSQ